MNQDKIEKIAALLVVLLFGVFIYFTAIKVQDVTTDQLKLDSAMQQSLNQSTFDAKQDIVEIIEFYAKDEQILEDIELKRERIEKLERKDLQAPQISKSLEMDVKGDDSTKIDMQNNNHSKSDSLKSKQRNVVKPRDSMLYDKAENIDTVGDYLSTSVDTVVKKIDGTAQTKSIDLADKKKKETRQPHTPVTSNKKTTENNLDPGKCVIIIGAFELSENIERLSRMIKEDGYRKFVKVRNGLNIVGVYVPCDKETLQSELNTIRKKYASDAYVRKNK